MIIVEFCGPINRESIQIEVANLTELANILKQDESVSGWLDSCAVALNDKIVSSKEIMFKDGDRISLLPPVCGG